MADIRTTPQREYFGTVPDQNPLSVGGKYARLTSNDSTHLSQGALRVGGGDVHGQSVGGSNRMYSSYWTESLVAGNQEIWARASGTSDNGNASGLGFFTNAGGNSSVVDGYYVYWIDFAVWDFEIWRWDNGVRTQIYTNSNNVHVNAGDLLLARINGTAIEGWYSKDSGANWTMSGSATDNTYRGDMSLALFIRDYSSGLPSYDLWGGTSAFTPRTQIYRVLEGTNPYVPA